MAQLNSMQNIKNQDERRKREVQGMTELKTLKDFETYGYLGNGIDKDDLKQEAIKWIKELENEIKKDDSRLPLWKFSGYDAEGYHSDLIIKWIKHFFNITEEELGK